MAQTTAQMLAYFATCGNLAVVKNTNSELNFRDVLAEIAEHAGGLADLQWSATGPNDGATRLVILIERNQPGAGKVFQTTTVQNI